MSHPAHKLLALVLLVFVYSADASPLFEDDTILPISVTGPLGSLLEHKMDREELDFVLRADDVEHQVEVRVRGKSRTRVCDFPPLRVDFRKHKTGDTVFAGQNKLKLVTHCSDSEAAQVNLLQEYTAYKIFNLISDMSYKVRLVRITYTDTDEQEKRDAFVSYGFFIESPSELADRAGGETVEESAVYLSSFEPRQAAAVFVFQYLIGNTDWSLVANEADEFCCHNTDIFDTGQHRLIIPYDFDLSGLVNASYARPDPSLHMRSVTRRRYRGYCLAPEAVEGVIRAIAGQRDDILETVRQVPGLGEKDLEKTVKYLEEYFEKTGNVDKFMREVNRMCL